MDYLGRLTYELLRTVVSAMEAIGSEEYLKEGAVILVQEKAPFRYYVARLLATYLAS